MSVDIATLGDQIAGLTLKQAVELSTYLKETHKIEAAAGAPVVQQGGGGGPAAPAAEVKDSFDVVLTGFGDKKLNVIKVVRELVSGLSLPDAKNMVEKVPSKIKEALSKDEANAVKKKLEEAGGTVELK
jgi:large subunit ribosomal protein L7/L12